MERLTRDADGDSHAVRYNRCDIHSNAYANPGWYAQTPTTGELPSDNPPVNFRVASYNDTLVWVQWEIPHNRGIASYILQKYDHDGNGFVADPYGRWEGAASGGNGFGKSYGDLTPDTRYKFTAHAQERARRCRHTEVGGATHATTRQRLRACHPTPS